MQTTFVHAFALAVLLAALPAVDASLLAPSSEVSDESDRKYITLTPKNVGCYDQSSTDESLPVGLFIQGSKYGEQCTVGVWVG